MSKRWAGVTSRAVAGATTAGRRFPLLVSSWMAHACQVAGRDLSAAEWDSYVPSRPYRQTGQLSEGLL